MEESGVLIGVSLHEGHGDAAVGIQRPPQQEVTAQGSAGRPAEQGFPHTSTPPDQHVHGSQCSLTLPKSISLPSVLSFSSPPHQAGEATNPNTVEGQLDVLALTFIQSAFRGHLARCTAEMKRYSPEAC